MPNLPTANVATSADEAARVLPRAEFRVFGQDILESVKARMWNGRTVLLQARKMPPEIYFVSRFTDAANVKVRGGLLDVKTKAGETPEGYEIFQPRGKFQFPVRREQLATILSYLAVVIALDRDSYSIEDFVAMARRHPDLAVVTVEKMRHGFTIDGVVCEHAEVLFNGAKLESACVESEDHAAMRAVVEGLGIAHLTNTNYVKAARSVIGMR